MVLFGAGEIRRGNRDQIEKLYELILCLVLCTIIPSAPHRYLHPANSPSRTLRERRVWSSLRLLALRSLLACLSCFRDLVPPHHLVGFAQAHAMIIDHLRFYLSRDQNQKQYLPHPHKTRVRLVASVV